MMRSKRLLFEEALKDHKSPPTKPRVAFVDGPGVNKYRTYSVDERYNASLSLLRSIGRQQQNYVPAIVNGRRAKEIVTDAAVGEKLKVVALEKQISSTEKPCVAFVDGPRAKEIVTNAAVGEKLNVVSLEKQISSTEKPCVAFVDGPRPNEFLTDAVDERRNDVALEKQRSSTTKFCPLINNVSWANEIVSIAVDARLNVVALKKQRSSTTKPCSADMNGSKADKIVTDPVDDRFNAVDDMLDAGDDFRDEDADTRDTDQSDIRDEDADILDVDGKSDMRIVGDQSLPTNSDEDADTINTWNDIRDEDAEILGLYGDSGVQIVEDQSLSTDSNEDADIFDADGNNDMHNVEGQSLPTNSEKAAGSSRKRKHDNVQRQVTDSHSESNNTNCTCNGQAINFRQSGFRKLIIFDKYGRPCDAGSEDFALYIGMIVRARCPPAIDDWRIVPQSMKEDIWKDVVDKYVVPEVYKPNILSRARTSWRNWKSALRVEMDKYDTIAERKLNMPERLIRKREDWESFVDFCNTDEDRKRRAIGKKAREAVEFKQSCGRKGIYRKIYELEKASPTGEVNRSAIFLDTHVSKAINDPASTSNSDIKLRLIKELVEANPDGQTDIDNDAVALVCGRDARGVVRGMGGGVSRTKVRASATIVETLRKVQQENKSLQSDIQLLIAQSGKHTQNHSSTPSYQFAPQVPDASNLPAHSSLAPDVTNIPARSPLAPPDVSDLPARSRVTPPASNLPVRSRVTPPASNLPARSRVTPPASNLPARSCLSPPASNTPAGSSLAPPAFNLPAHSSLAPDVTHSPARSRLAPPDVSDLPARSRVTPPASDLPARSRVTPPASNLPALSRSSPPASNLPALSRSSPPASNSPVLSRLAPPASNLPAHSSLAPPASNLPAHSSLAPDVTHSPTRLRLAPPDVSDLAARSHLVPPASDLPASSLLVHPASTLPASSRLVPPAPSLPASSRLVPPTSNLPASSCLAPPTSNLLANSCFIKNFKGRTIALGSFNTAEPPMEHVYSLIIEDIFDRDAELFDKDGKLGDIMIGGVINWPKACVESNLPANSCFIRNFKRRTIAFGSFSTAADRQMEHVYSVTVQEIFDRHAELFDTDGKLGDITIGGVINWPKACIKPCRQ